jgi:hypothetical protein
MTTEPHPTRLIALRTAPITDAQPVLCVTCHRHAGPHWLYLDFCAFRSNLLYLRTAVLAEDSILSLAAHEQYRRVERRRREALWTTVQREHTGHVPYAALGLVEVGWVLDDARQLLNRLYWRYQPRTAHR